MTELEMQRIANIKGLGELNGDPGPGSRYCHEALHMTSFLKSAIDSELCNHPTICANPEWFKLAIEAQERLADLYQAIGSAHLHLNDPNE
jgi:hypothetical protein